MSASETAGPTPGTALVKTDRGLPARPPKLRAVDREFLPAALEIIETPASPAGRAMILVICAFAASALAWSYIGTLDIIAMAQGKLQPAGRVKTVQAFETSHVLAVEAQNGMHVNAGDVLVRLDSRDATADEGATRSELASYAAESLRRKAAMDLVRTGATAPVPSVVWPDDIPTTTRANEDQVLGSDLSQLGSQIASLRAQAAQKRAERDRLTATVAAEIELLRTMQDRVDMRNELFEKNSGSKASLIDALEVLQQQKTSLARDSGQLAEVEANLDAITQDIQKSLGTFVAENAQKFVEAQRKVESLREKLVRDQVRNGFMTIKSPIGGIVQASTLTTVGQVVSPSEELMRIVPDGATLEVECYLPNKDIGFVKEGQTAILKLEAFPFTQYGMVNARVVRVAHDAVPEPDAQQTEQDPSRANRNGMRAGAQRMQNLVFPVTLTLEKSAIDVGGTLVPLQPGMAVTAEIKTGRRRIIEYILSPLLETGSQAMKER